MDKKNILEKTWAFAERAMANNDSAHDKGHLARVVNLATILAQQTGADQFRTQMLAILHELDDDKLSSQIGVEAVAAFLQAENLPQEMIDFLCMGIPYISYRKHPRLSRELPLEIRIVQDADRIDAMGAVGIARTFAYGGAKGRVLEESLAHFDEKLLKLYDLLSTQQARELAKLRYDFLQEFYRQFREENR